MEDMKFFDLQNKWTAIEARIEDRNQIIADIEKSVQHKKYCIDMSEDVWKVLDSMQERMHEHSLGRLESLLSSLVADIFPDRDMKVRLELSIERNCPALRFAMETAEGHREDILSGKGGSIINVLSVGLKFIVLAQTHNLTPVIVLDEPDCWMHLDRVPAFASVIRQLSHKLNIQVVMISHHSPEFFSGAKIISLRPDGKKGVRVEGDTGIDEWSPERRGIRSFCVENFMTHEKTHINLSPEVTVITGDNDLGKSALVTALRSAVYGEGHADYIRHETEGYSVTLDMGQDGVFVHTRNKRGARKIRYKLSDNQDNVIHESQQAKLPDWVMDTLGLGSIEGLEVQVGHQKRPVFLLDQPPSAQARLLSVGKEAHYLLGMQNEYKDDVKEYKRDVKREEKRYATLQRNLDMIRQMGVKSSMGAISVAHKKISEELDKTAQLESLLERLEGLQQIKQAYRQMPGVPQAPELLDEFKLSGLVENMLKAQRVAGRAGVFPKICQAPELDNTDSLGSMLSKLETLEKMKGRLSQVRAPEVPEEPVFADTHHIVEVGQKISGANKKYFDSYQQLKHAQGELKEAEDSWSALIQEIGGICPLCENMMQQAS